ncbi:hypothetical protein JZ751_011259 [Albula glossodonta]|uniref:Uncharacterized protein n=1 Tax=Albula glossodonta TaxID=121402 RepID=A0A8T2P7G9_9TELE|nr:hypothetical protein JZ751_011259 [Albula glossodonta]
MNHKRLPLSPPQQSSVPIRDESLGPDSGQVESLTAMMSPQHRRVLGLYGSVEHKAHCVPSREQRRVQAEQDGTEGGRGKENERGRKIADRPEVPGYPMQKNAGGEARPSPSAELTASAQNHTAVSTVWPISCSLGATFGFLTGLIIAPAWIHWHRKQLTYKSK